MTRNKRCEMAHSVYKVNYKSANFISIILHNMSGYDVHLFVRKMYSNKDKIEVIAQNKDKSISFTNHLYKHGYPGSHSKKIFTFI